MLPRVWEKAFIRSRDRELELLDEAKEAQPRENRQRFWKFNWSSSKAFLKKTEKNLLYTWVQLHNFRSLSQLPKLPKDMPAEVLPDDGTACDVLADDLDRCIESCKKVATYWTAFSRMYHCKPYWVKLTRCVRRRDDRIMKAVHKWEFKHYNTLPLSDKEEYMGKMTKRMKYLEYVHTAAPSEEEIYKHSKELHQLGTRIHNLTQKPDPLNDMKPIKTRNYDADRKFRWLLTSGFSQDPIAPLGGYYQAEARKKAF